MDLESGRPRHEQISDYLREQIESGGYEIDEQLPSEKQLGATFDVSEILTACHEGVERFGVLFRRSSMKDTSTGVRGLALSYRSVTKRRASFV